MTLLQQREALRRKLRRYTLELKSYVRQHEVTRSDAVRRLAGIQAELSKAQTLDGGANLRRKVHRHALALAATDQQHVLVLDAIARRLTITGARIAEIDRLLG